MIDKKSNLSRTGLFILIGCEGILCIGVFLFFAVRELSVSIKPNERGLVRSQGMLTGAILEPGQHFLMPGQTVTLFDVSPQTYVMISAPNLGDDAIQGTTRDGQKFEVDLSITYAIDPNKIPELYKIWRDRYEDGLVRPQSRGITRSVVEGYTFTEISLKHAEIQQAIFDQLAPQLAGQYLTLVKVDVIDIRRAAQ